MTETYPHIDSNFYPVKIIEEYFNGYDLLRVSKNYWKYLTSKNSSGDFFREVHYMDLMNQNTVNIDYIEPYFIFSDISDYFDYEQYIYDNSFIWPPIAWPGGDSFVGYYKSTITGRGTVSIEIANQGNPIMYKIRVSTLPHFSIWASKVIELIINFQ